MLEIINSSCTIKSLLNFLKLLVLLQLLSSCTASSPYQAYQGEQLSSTEVSTLKNTLRISPTGDDQIKISHIDQVKMPGFQSAFQILPGHHQISACYSEAYQEKSILDSWFGKFCSIHGTFSFDYEFIKSHTYELSIKPINKSFAYQEIKVFMVDRTQRTQMEVEVFEKSLSLDCTQEEPNLLSYIVSKCN
jgi:hypothetical protein